MNKKPKVSVLVPSYNHGAYIRDRILSIVNQSYKNIELIVIDDASTDDSHVAIAELQNLYGFQYFRNKLNSGSPFSGWEEICKLATGKYIWICESDDIAESIFLEFAVDNLEREHSAAVFFCSSFIINEDNKIIDHTDTFFRDIWREDRWNNDFISDGSLELAFQMRGQTIPNMSSALFRADAFRAAYNPFLKNLKLTGDWLFVGNVLRQGKLIFKHVALNKFRKHDFTARTRVNSARSQAEFIIVKYRLFCDSGRSIGEFAPLMGSDAVRFIHEDANFFDVLRALLEVSWRSAIGASILLFLSLLSHPNYIRLFFLRIYLVKLRKLHE